MYSYLALIWNPAEAAAAATAKLVESRLHSVSADWAKVVEAEGLLAFHADTNRGTSETRVLAEHQGAVFGRLFRSGHELQSSGGGVIDVAESARILATRGSHLIGYYWGRYVAIFRDTASGDVMVLRDPTGSLPCFFTSYRDVTLVFSDIESCLALELLRFSINWKYIAGFVPYSTLQIRDTGLNEVTEVQAGERITFRLGRAERAALWSPVEASQLDPIEDPERAIAEVRDTVRRCVHAWASLHRSVLHNLSGGLDSSIVLSCLKNAPTHPEVTCLHYFSPFSNEDERKYARLAASHMKADLVESALDPSTVRLDRMLQIRRAPKPWFYVYDLLHSPIEAHLAAEKDATGVFSGSGGDGLFLQARADLAVADYLRRHGYRPGVVGIALNAARITRNSVWPILRQGVQRHLKRPSKDLLEGSGEARTLIPAAVIEAARHDENLIHPWIRAAEGLSPGVLWHILCLSMPPSFYESFGGATEVERTVVLMSQPLIELCLRIPSYVWITGGIDRAIARRAFAPDLPAIITRRRQKGAIDLYNLKLLDANEPFVREMLMDGELVKHGLLDRDRLDKYLRPDHSRAGFEYNDVLRHHLCTEVWVRRWSEDMPVRA